MPNNPLIPAQAGTQSPVLLRSLSSMHHLLKGWLRIHLGPRLRGDERKWIGPIALLFTVLLAASVQAQTVGYQHLSMPDPSGPPVEVGIWYPSKAEASPRPLQLFQQTVAEDGPVAGHDLPLVVISHGTGGGFTGHYDTALALARAGYVVAALTHTGDNFRDHSQAVNIANRPRQLKLLIDWMLSGWSQHAAIDPSRIGAFGFSAGGFTVLAAAGAEPDFAAVRPHCASHPDLFDCDLIKRFPAAVAAMEHLHRTWVHDARIKAVVSAAPAMGYAFGASGLANVRVPVQLWAAEFDHILPPAEYAEKVRADLPAPPEFHRVADADHYDFLAPCSKALRQQAPDICTSRPGFDREAFHREFDRQVVVFFDRTLSVNSSPASRRRWRGGDTRRDGGG